jgi:hypothetical protein
MVRISGTHGLDPQKILDKIFGDLTICDRSRR